MAPFIKGQYWRKWHKGENGGGAVRRSLLIITMDEQVKFKNEVDENCD